MVLTSSPVSTAVEEATLVIIFAPDRGDFTRKGFVCLSDFDFIDEIVV
jgi:hypothetical protein